MTSKIICKNQLFTLCVGVFILFFITRFLFLDEDLPPWGIINYQPIDEGAYATLALNQYNYGELAPDIINGEVEFITSPHIKTSIIGNLFVYASLKIFGDNYWGLRGSSVFCGFIIFVLYLFILKLLFQKYCLPQKKQKLAILGFALLFIFDFNFLMACRVVETSIYRLLFIMLIIIAFLKIEGSVFVRFAFIGGLTTLSVFAVYITNLFLYLALILTLIGFGIIYGRNTFIKGVLGLLSGSMIVLFIIEVYYIKVWDTYAIENAFSTFYSFSSQEGYSISASWWKLLRTSIHFLSSNANLYNISLFAIFLICIPYFMYLVFKHKDVIILFFLSIYACLYLQTLVSEDYITRKYIIIYPILLFCLAIIVAEYENIRAIFLDKYHNKIFIRLLLLYVTLCVLCCLLILIFRFYIISNGTQHDFSNEDIYIVLFLGGGSLVLVLLGTLSFIKRIVLKKCIFISCIICISLIHLYFDAKYVFLNRTYTERQCMISIGEAVGNNYVIGSFFPMGYTLYNDVKPIITSTENMVKVLEKYPDIWCLDYTDTGEYGVRGYLDSLFINSSFELKNYKNYYREFKTFGISRNVALYKVNPKSN